jgi:hypothetical protein
MREDGLRLDRIVITSNVSYVPAGAGPAESPRTTETAATAAETATATSTPEPTATPTLDASPAATETATTEVPPTETPVETTTPEPTAVPTEQPTETPTLEPTATADIVPTEAVEPTVAAANEPEPYPLLRARRSRNSTPATGLVDRDPATYWITDGAEIPVAAYVTIDLGQVRPVGTVRWLFAIGELADGMRIDVSTDGATWVTVAEPGNAEPGMWQEAAVGLDAQYVRWYFANPNGDLQLGGLAEVEVWP